MMLNIIAGSIMAGFLVAVAGAMGIAVFVNRDRD